MPIQETAGWQALAKIVAPVVAAIGSLVWWLIRRWVDDRFQSVEGRVSQNEKDIEDLTERVNDHDVAIGEHGVHLEHIRENGDATRASIRRLHEKFDNHIASNGKRNQSGS